MIKQAMNYILFSLINIKIICLFLFSIIAIDSLSITPINLKLGYNVFSILFGISKSPFIQIMVGILGKSKVGSGIFTNPQYSIYNFPNL